MTTRTPRFIWLQTGDDEESQPSSDGVTWSEDQVNDSDTKYIRADLAEPDPAADPVHREGDSVEYVDEWGCKNTLTLAAAAEQLRQWENEWPGGLDEVASSIKQFRERAEKADSGLIARQNELSAANAEVGKLNTWLSLAWKRAEEFEVALKSAEQERDALAKDAERYRWIRGKIYSTWATADGTHFSGHDIKITTPPPGTVYCGKIGNALDTAIDAAIISGRDAT